MVIFKLIGIEMFFSSNHVLKSTHQKQVHYINPSKIRIKCKFIMQEETSELQFCNIEFKEILQHSSNCKIKIVGIIKSIFSAKKYIIEVYINDQLQIRSIRKYNQFEATYDVIKMKFSNFQMDSFPSKYQVFSKDQTRKQYFQSLMNKIVQNYTKNPQNEASKRLFSILYLFMTRSLSHKQKPLKQSKDASESYKSFEKKRKLSLHDQKVDYSEQSQKPHKGEKKSLEVTDIKPESLSEYALEKHRVRRNSQGSFIECYLGDNNFQDKNDQIKQNLKDTKTIKHKTLMKLSEFNPKKQHKDCYYEIKFQNQKQWRKRYLKVQNNSLYIYKDNMENHFRTKIQLYRIQVENYHRQLNLFDHFCQKMDLDNEPQFPEDSTIIALSHQYDYQKFLIRGLNFELSSNSGTDLAEIKKFNIKEQLKLESFKQLLKKASEISPINQKFEGVFNPIGKIFIVIHKLTINKIDENQRDILKIKVKTLNLQYECKKLILKQENTIKQGFFIPISNAFQTISIQAIVVREQGWIRQEFKDLNIGFHQIQFSNILTKYQGHKFEKVNVLLLKSADTPSDFIDKQTYLQYSLENYSHFSSIYSESFASQNDGKAITGLKLQDMDQLSVTVDRVLRIIGHIAIFIIKFWRSVFLFKYPKLAKTFFTLMLLLSILASAKVFISLFFIVLVMVILYNHPQLHKPIKIILQETLLSQIHPDFIQPLCLGTTEIKYRKWCDALERTAKQYKFSRDNKLEKRENLQKQSVIQYYFQVHGKRFRVTEQVKGFIGKVFEGKKVIEVVSRIISGIVNIVEKFSNLFMWVDTKRSSLLLLVLIIFSGVANDFLVRAIGIIFCIHRLYKGMKYYKLKHYQRNRRIAVYTLRYIIRKHFMTLIQYDENLNSIQSEKEILRRKLVIQQSKCYEEIGSLISSLEFPLNDEGSLKKFKSQIQKLIGVYLDTDELKQENLEMKDLKASQKSNKIDYKTGKTETNDNKKSGLTESSNNKYESVSMSKIIKMMESCQSRMTLDWVPGQEGLSNEFQELKRQTKQIPLIDIWIENFLINFVSNVPSQMFIKLKNEG